MACLAATVVGALFLRFLTYFYNKKKQRQLSVMDPLTLDAKREEMAFADETDMRNPFFSYTG